MSLFTQRLPGGGIGTKIGPITTGVRYTVSVRFVNYLGNWSDWVTAVAQQSAGDPGAPGLPTAVSGAPSAAGEALLNWTNPADANLAAIEIWYSETNDSAGATFIASATAPAETALVRGLPESANTYFWLKARSVSGDVSAFHAGVNDGVYVLTN